VPGPDQAWTSLEWRRLAAQEPLVSFTTAVRWPGGFVAVAASDTTTQLFLSTDGDTWQPVAGGVTGENAAIGVQVVGGSIFALSLSLPTAPCDPESVCPELVPPLLAWSSTDGITWTSHGSPIELAAPLPDSLLTLPLFAALPDAAIVLAGAGNDMAVARTDDGETWQLLPPDGLPRSLDPISLTTVGGGFLLTGTKRGGDGLAAAAWSADGAEWQQVSVFGERAARIFDARPVAVGAGGVVVEGTTDLAPGPTWWWTSSDGQAWRFLADLEPLGIWHGEGAGTGLLPDGELVGDGERMVAYDTVDGTAAWTSFEGATWTELAIKGDKPPSFGFPSLNLTLLPTGLLWRDDEGSAWFAKPAS
jgi:hypothetical protein